MSGTRSIRRAVSLPTETAGLRKEKYPAPGEFRPARDTPPGRLPLLAVFEGLERTVPFRKYPGDDEAILRIAKHTWAHVTDGPGWMYVAPTRGRRFKAGESGGAATSPRPLRAGGAGGTRTS